MPSATVIDGMGDDLRFENITLRQQLEGLLLEARQNEVKLRRFDQLERQLIGARSLPELIWLLLRDYRAAFELESVTLSLIDPEFEIARILEMQGEQLPIPGLDLQNAPERIAALYHDGLHPHLGAYDELLHAGLMAAENGDTEPGIASVALLPLMRGDTLIGSLNLGSVAADRYVSGAGIDFLGRLATVAGICLDNALAHERLKSTGLTDALTGVQNRRYFEHRCHVEVCQAHRHRRALACMFIDIDHFKRVNDTHGHQAGDAVLRGVAHVIQEQLRASDTLARYGGEEFILLLPRTSGVHAAEIAERIRAAVAASAFKSLAGEAVPVTISIGLSMLETGPVGKEEAQAEAMIAAADKALYEAKRRGRNQVVATGTGSGCQTPVPRPRLWRWACIRLQSGLLRLRALFRQNQRA